MTKDKQFLKVIQVAKAINMTREKTFVFLGKESS
jgi:hypothetical protein